MGLTIKENSWVGKMAAKKLGTQNVAIVIGTTIHLYNVTREEFLCNEKWLKHEMCHIEQFATHGFYTFIIKYLWESLKSGYYNNKYEIEARKAEES